MVCERKWKLCCKDQVLKMCSNDVASKTAPLGRRLCTASRTELLRRIRSRRGTPTRCQFKAIRRKKQTKTVEAGGGGLKGGNSSSSRKRRFQSVHSHWSCRPPLCKCTKDLRPPLFNPQPFILPFSLNQSRTAGQEVCRTNRRGGPRTPESGHSRLGAARSRVRLKLRRRVQAGCRRTTRRPVRWLSVRSLASSYRRLIGARGS
jgi:hypothetical protein